MKRKKGQKDKEIVEAIIIQDDAFTSISRNQFILLAVILLATVFAYLPSI